MTRVHYIRRGNHFSLVCCGHADFAEKGKDIVCAGISALCGALEIALDNLQDRGIAASCFCRSGDGFFCAEAEAVPQNSGIQTAFDVVYDGLCRIGEGYPMHLSCRRITLREEVKA